MILIGVMIAALVLLLVKSMFLMPEFSGNNQDCENEGWAWRIAYRYGGEESGQINELSDVQDLLNAITRDCDVD